MAVDLGIAVVAADRAGAIADGRNAQAYLHAHAAVARRVVADVLQALDGEVTVHGGQDPVGARLRAAQDRVAAGVHGQHVAGLHVRVVPRQVLATALALAAARAQVDAEAVLGSPNREAHANAGAAALAVGLLAGGVLLGGKQDVALRIQDNVAARGMVRSRHDDVGPVALAGGDDRHVAAGRNGGAACGNALAGAGLAGAVGLR